MFATTSDNDGEGLILYGFLLAVTLLAVLTAVIRSVIDRDEPASEPEEDCST